jgi:hypothetical protein
LGVGRNVKLAYCWYQLGAVNGDPHAHGHVAELEASGQAVAPGDTTTCQGLNHPDVLIDPTDAGAPEATR